NSRNVSTLYCDIATMGRIFCPKRPGQHSRKNAKPHNHCCKSNRGLNTNGACSSNNHLSALSGTPGFAQGSEYETDSWPPLARLVCWAGPAWRSITTTSCPAWDSHQAVDVPIIPLPSTATFMSRPLIVLC